MVEDVVHTLARWEKHYKLLEEKAGYNPNQPRVPAGNPNGGQWTDDAYSGGSGTIPASMRKPHPPSPRPVIIQPHTPFPGNEGTRFIRSIPNASGKLLKRVNIFIGGFGDDWIHGIVKDSPSLNRLTYGDNYYASWTSASYIRQLISQIPQDYRINIIGHSYGGSTAANLAVEMPGRIHTLITVDPISRTTTPDMKKVSREVTRWININAAKNSSDASDRIALTGGKWGNDPEEYADIYLKVPFNHDDFTPMMMYIPLNKVSVQTLLNQ